MERKREQRYGEKFRRCGAEQMNAPDNIGRLSQKLGVTRRLQYEWRDDLEALYSQANMASQLSTPVSLACAGEFGT